MFPCENATVDRLLEGLGLASLDQLWCKFPTTCNLAKQWPKMLKLTESKRAMCADFRMCEMLVHE